jgi:triacylglycerol lipase
VNAVGDRRDAAIVATHLPGASADTTDEHDVARIRSISRGTHHVRTALQQIALVLVLLTALPVQARECVVLLHGLARSPSSMNKLADAFSERGYTVANVGYPSRTLPVEELAALATEAGLSRCAADDTVHFVTHSLGGILVRYFLAHDDIDNLGRVVMLAPPNHGSKVVDRLRNFPGFKLLNGPAGRQLGTDRESVPLQLGPVDYEVGVIAGTKTVNLILSQFLERPNDGKVSVRSARVEGMKAFITVPHSHPFIMNAPGVIAQAISFIETGEFQPSG